MIALARHGRYSTRVFHRWLVLWKIREAKVTPAARALAGSFLVAGGCTRRSRRRHSQCAPPQGTTALATARHHSSGPVVTRREEQEEVEHETHCGLRAPTAPPPWTRTAPLSEGARPPLAAVTVGYVAAGAPTGWTKRRSSSSSSRLCWRARQWRAREVEEVRQLEEKVKKLELVLVLEAKTFHILPRRDLSNLQGLVLDWAKERLRLSFARRLEKEKKKRRRKRMRWRRGRRWFGLFSAACHGVSCASCGFLRRYGWSRPHRASGLSTTAEREIVPDVVEKFGLGADPRASRQQQHHRVPNVSVALNSTRKVPSRSRPTCFSVATSSLSVPHVLRGKLRLGADLRAPRPQHHHCLCRTCLLP